ncbi:hypothetical protein SEA_CEN1621_74 [Microbacterium phage Cen1621]|uniref:Uncharacterized protein n=1 Tax=Microbacterium phage Cen1621 TaxID=2965191 RepID=A0A9E7QAR9_9CAUD|nr:hypothetical protein SEA_CEN1621_74 [Microbacterium phage Cen1621]
MTYAADAFPFTDQESYERLIRALGLYPIRKPSTTPTGKLNMRPTTTNPYASQTATYPATAKSGARVKLRHKDGDAVTEFTIGAPVVEAVSGRITAIKPKGSDVPYTAKNWPSFELLKAAPVPLPTKPGVYVVEGTTDAELGDADIFVLDSSGEWESIDELYSEDELRHELNGKGLVPLTVKAVTGYEVKRIRLKRPAIFGDTYFAIIQRATGRAEHFQYRDNAVRKAAELNADADGAEFRGAFSRDEYELLG